MDWSKGYSASYYGTFVDAYTWRDLTRFEITGGSISASDSQLINSADVNVVNYDNGERWIRVWLDAKQGESITHVPMFTGLATSPKRDINGVISSSTLECYSVLKPAADILLQRGWYVPAGYKSGDMIKQLLSVIPAPFKEEGVSPYIKQTIVAEDGETNLSMVTKILNVIGWRLKIDGYGNVTLAEFAAESSVRYDELWNDSVEPVLTVENDWFSCPNVFRAVADDVSAVARDDSPYSPLSTVNRGREVWEEETNCSLAETETIAEYADRMLKQAQKSSVKITYDRRYNPYITVGDLITLNYPKQKIQGMYRITSQSIQLSHGAKTSEEVVEA